MIDVDISNIWGELALQDLLAIEQEIFAAHAALPAYKPCEEAERILKAADTIRTQSQVCVVLGSERCCLGARAAIELLRPASETDGPRILFAGSSLSTRQWNDLKGQLEGTDFSVIVVSRSGDTLESAIALRGLKWMLERKYGTDECNRRLFAVTDPCDGALRQMAEEHSWESFSLEDGSVLSPGGLLPMAAAGIDITQLLFGAAQARNAYDLRSFENPAWLYATVRSLMHRSGKSAELLAYWEPDFALFGKWWQRLFLETGGSGLIPVPAELPAGLPSLDRMVQANQRNFFETMIRFVPSSQSCLIDSDVTNPDGFEHLAGESFSSMEEQRYLDTLEAHADGGVPIITMDCGDMDAHTVGSLFAFLELSCALSARTQEDQQKNSQENS